MISDVIKVSVKANILCTLPDEGSWCSLEAASSITLSIHFPPISPTTKITLLCYKLDPLNVASFGQSSHNTLSDILYFMLIYGTKNDHNKRLAILSGIHFIILMRTSLNI